MWLIVLVVLSVIGICFSTENSHYKSVVCVNGRKCSLKDGIVDGTHAHGHYQDDVLTSGWGKLWVHGDDTLQGSYEAGFLEGALTTTRIYQHYKSWYNHQFPSPPTNSTVQFMLDQYHFMLDLSSSQPSGDINEEYLGKLRHVIAQFQGLMEGFSQSATSGQKMSLLDFLLLEGAGDLYDIIPATNPAMNKLHVGKLSAAEFNDEYHRVVSCSAIVKVADDKSDVFFGHTTWTTYANMLRIFKNYDLQGGKYQASFSSKPGVIYSKDDFYVLHRKDQNMGVMETTNGVMNSELYKLVTPRTLLTWQRMPIANSLATSGKQWTDIFSILQSGTYCNQYMVIDLKHFTPGVGPDDKDFLWIVEVVPGTAAASDVSKLVIDQGNYWPSYNVPFTPLIYNISGYLAAYETYGDSYSYTKCARAQMMRRDHPSLQSLEQVGAELRQNDYQNDPLSAGDPYLAISSRKDLRTSSAGLTGGIDSKVSSYSKVVNRSGGSTSIAQSGPTHDNQAPFAWSTADPNLVKNEIYWGQPDKFDFPFVDMDFYAF